ncbi:MAG: AcrR family transcriptional regulator [Saprospiraceae bacterium]|jgi:AcrR family transcriptional regulator
MQLSKKQIKENRIIDAASALFSEVGYKNAKMDDIAKLAGMTKVTLYSYFQSKENLYLAVIYRAFQALSEVFYTSIDAHKEESGLESTIGIFSSFFEFCEQHFLYSEAIMDYFSMIRNISRDASNEDADKSLVGSIYFVRIQDLQNLPLKLTVKEIERGKADGSIRPDIDAMLHTIQGWTMVVGYIKLLIASGKNESPLLNVNLKTLKSLSLSFAKEFLRHGGASAQ